MSIFGGHGCERSGTSLPSYFCFFLPRLPLVLISYTPQAAKETSGTHHATAMPDPWLPPGATGKCLYRMVAGTDPFLPIA